MSQFRVAIVDAAPAPDFTERIGQVLSVESPPDIIRVTQAFDLVTATHALRRLRQHGIAADLIPDSPAIVAWAHAGRLVIIAKMCTCPACQVMHVPTVAPPAPLQKPPGTCSGKLESLIPGVLSFFIPHQVAQKIWAWFFSTPTKPRDEEECRGK